MKKVIVALLLDKRNWEKIACLLLAVFILVVLPVMVLAAAFSTEGIDFTDPEIIAEIMESLIPEQVEELQFVEDTVQGFHLAMADRTPQQVKAAEVLFLLALYDRAREPDFIEKLAGCFEESQTDEQLIEKVNTAFDTALDPDDFSAIMSYANHQLVEIAKSQLGNVGGKPFWSWYGFGGRVEWCACFVSWCANQCGYIDRGIIPKFSSCTVGANWFKSKGQWLNGSAVPTSGMIIFFDWQDEYGVRDGLPDHVGIVEKVEGSRIYTIEGNSGDVCRRNSYPVGYSEIFGYRTPNLF